MSRSIKYAMIVLGIVLVFLFAFLVRDYRDLRREQVISARKVFLAAFVKNHGHLAVGDATVIRPWMTFDYVNKLFGLPTAYLQDQLMVTNPHYPQVTLSGYANAEHVNVTAFVTSVEDAVRSYTATATQATSTALGG